MVPQFTTPAMDDADRRHSSLFIAAALGIAFFAMTPLADAVPDRAVITLCVAAVVLAGLPHGALDLWISRDASFWRSAKGFVGFHTAYLAGAAGVIAAFLIVPYMALAAFLLASLLHFADDWRRILPTPLRIAAATLLIVLPALFHPAEVHRIFAIMAGDGGSGGMTGTTPGAEARWAGAFVATSVILAAAAFRRRAGLEIGALALLAMAAPPLVLFTVYFALLHSPRHFLRHRSVAEGTNRRAILATYTVVAVGAVVAVDRLFFTQAATIGTDGTMVRMLFIGLAALTFPHMLLLEAAARRDRATEEKTLLARFRRPSVPPLRLPGRGRITLRD